MRSLRRQAALSLALLAASTPLSALAAAELTEEQNVIVEAWAAVQRGFVDQQFNGKDWKAIKSDYLKRKYKSMAEARGAVSVPFAAPSDVRVAVNLQILKLARRHGAAFRQLGIRTAESRSHLARTGGGPSLREVCPAVPDDEALGAEMRSTLSVREKIAISPGPSTVLCCQSTDKASSPVASAQKRKARGVAR